MPRPRNPMKTYPPMPRATVATLERPVVTAVAQELIDHATHPDAFTDGGPHPLEVQLNNEINADPALRALYAPLTIATLTKDGQTMPITSEVLNTPDSIKVSWDETTDDSPPVRDQNIGLDGTPYTKLLTFANTSVATHALIMIADDHLRDINARTQAIVDNMTAGELTTHTVTVRLTDNEASYIAHLARMYQHIRTGVDQAVYRDMTSVRRIDEPEETKYELARLMVYGEVNQ